MEASASCTLGSCDDDACRDGDASCEPPTFSYTGRCGTRKDAVHGVDERASLLLDDVRGCG